MKTIKAFGPGKLKMVETADPVPGNGEVLIAIRVCGICGSDKWFWNVKEPVEYVAGHEVSGEVLKVGKGVFNLKIGDRVAVNNVRGCGECPACRHGHFVRCIKPIVHMGHGFSELTVVPAINCILLNEKISFEEGSLIFDMWGTPFGALERASVSDKNDVLILGCGPIGLGAISLAKMRNAYVIAVDTLPYRREAALRAGANAALAPDDSALLEIAGLTSGLGPDVVIECSGKPAAYQLAFSCIRIGGTLVSVGDGACFEFKPGETVVAKSLNLLGSFYSTMEQGRHIQNLMLSNQITPLSFITHRFKLEELPDVFGKVIDCSDGILKSLVII